MCNRDSRLSGARLLLTVGSVLFLAIIYTAVALWNGMVSRAAPASTPLTLPAGFKVEVYATGLNTPRFVSFSPDGDLYVAEFGSTDNVVKVLPDRDHDGKADRTIVFARGLNSPNNVAFYQGSAYVGELGRIWRLQDTNGDL